jgi:pimeloyl-ACP methyl ester carboxylesterase
MQDGRRKLLRRAFRRRATTLTASICGLVAVALTGATSAPAGLERSVDTARAAPSVASSGTAGLSLPRPTGRFSVGVRSAFVLDPARTEPVTGGPRALPVRVWYPAKRARGTVAPYTSASVQAGLEGFFGAPAGLFDVDTHATVDAPTRREVRGVLLVSPAFGNVVAFYTGLVTELASRGYALVAFDHPHDGFLVEQPDGTLIEGDVVDDAAAFQARLLDVGVVLGALRELVPQARRQTPIGIFGHSNGGATAGEAMTLHPQIRAGVNLDGFIPGGSFIPGALINGLDRPFGLMLSTDQTPEGLQEIETFLSNMRAPHPVRSLEIRHQGYSDFVVFNPQVQRIDPALAAIIEATIATGTLDSLRSGRRALERQRTFLVRFFNRHLGKEHAEEGDGEG